MACKAIQYSDEMHCAPCGLRWDTNDPDPPPCRLDAPPQARPEETEDDGFVTIYPSCRAEPSPRPE